MRYSGSGGFDREKKLGSCRVGAEHRGYCCWQRWESMSLMRSPSPCLRIEEKKRRRPVVVLKILRVLKVLGARKATLALGFKTFWCTDMGLLVCSYGRLWKIRCTDMGTGCKN